MFIRSCFGSWGEGRSLVVSRWSCVCTGSPVCTDVYSFLFWQWVCGTEYCGFARDSRRPPSVPSAQAMAPKKPSMSVIEILRQLRAASRAAAPKLVMSGDRPQIVSC
jgi:hypothetical protein